MIKNKKIEETFSKWKVNSCGDEKLPSAIHFSRNNNVKGRDLMISGIQKASKTVNDWKWPLIGGLDWGLLHGLSRLMASAIYLRRRTKRYWSTRKFEELSDWTEEIATVLDWAERKTRWLRLREGGGKKKKSWRLKGDDSPQ